MTDNPPCARIGKCEGNGEATGWFLRGYKTYLIAISVPAAPAGLPLINKRMSTNQNQVYQENIWDNVMEACHEQEFEKAYSMAKAAKDIGFTFLGNQLEKAIATEESDYKANQEPNDNTHADGVEV